MPTLERDLVISLVKRNRFFILLIFQMLLLITLPVVEMLGRRYSPLIVRLLISIPSAALVVAAVLVVSDSRNVRIAAIVFGAPVVLLEILDVVFLNGFAHAASQAFTILFLSFSIVAILRFIFRSEYVNGNVIFASLCVYMLLGTLWAYGYAFIEGVLPGSFRFNGNELAMNQPLDIGGVQSISTFYFSFVTMTTLGFGDIVPVSSSAKMMATLQAVMGQLYMTVLVARLVGLHISHAAATRRSPEGPS